MWDDNYERITLCHPKLGQVVGNNWYPYFSLDTTHEMLFPVSLWLFQGLPPPEGITLFPKSMTSLNLSWHPLTLRTEDDIRVEVERKSVNDNGDESSVITQVPGNMSTLIIKDLEPRQQYMCRVRVNTRSQGEWSNYLYAWTFSDSKCWFTSFCLILHVTPSDQTVIWWLH